MPGSKARGTSRRAVKCTYRPRAPRAAGDMLHRVGGGLHLNTGLGTSVLSEGQVMVMACVAPRVRVMVVKYSATLGSLKIDLIFTMTTLERDE